MELKQLGPYEIGKRIGKGGMGAVYEAVDSTTGQVVAVKALSPHLADAEGFRERFEAEIESLKKLQHDGIVRMYGYGEDGGVLFYSMERVDGPSLDEQLNDGRRFDWHETLDIALQLCRALKHAHDHGVVHRDIKPANILLESDGRVKLADFGIARLFGSNQLTTAGGVLGTADYMSPEQADGRPVTDKCDQYTLGCVMYALLSGRPPFRAKTMPEMLQLQRYAEPEPVRRYAPDTPPQLDQLIRQLLSKDPDKRFPNALVLSRHIEAMSKALSRKEQNADEAADDAPPLPDDLDEHTAAANLDATQSAGSISLVTVGGDDEGLYDAPTLDEASAGEASDHDADPAETSESRPSRFTTVAEDALRDRREADESHWGQWLSLVGLVVLLAAMIYGGYRITRPASADEIYQEVTAAIQEDRTTGLREHRSDIEDFLDRFPEDPRADEFSEFQQELKLLGVATRLRIGSRVQGGERAEPTARWYAAAMALRETDPAGATEKLENLLLLYGVDPHSEDEQRFANPALGLDEQHRRWLRVAALELDRLREQLDGSAQAQLPLLEARLAAARQLASRDSAAARRVYQGIVELYGDDPWAADVVRAASEQLENLAP